MAEITDWIDRLHAGEPNAQDGLFAAAYQDLRVLARSRLRRGGRDTLMDTTGLVHECYLRCLASGGLQAEHRRAFFAYASQVMRSVIVDAVRERLAQKRGGDEQRVTLDTDLADRLPAGEQQVLDVHEALAALAQAEPRIAEVAQMRYFGGYSERDIADVLQRSDRTVRRDWEKARLLLQAMLSR